MAEFFVYIRDGSKLAKMPDNEIERVYRVRVLRKIYDEDGARLKISGEAENAKKLNREARK